MKKLTNYLQTAKDNEKVFRLILDKYKINHRDLSLEEVYKKYSTGERYRVFTILDFEKVSEILYRFSWENIGFLSGNGLEENYRIENNELEYLGKGASWMS